MTNNKYKAKKREVNGILFDSTKEASRYLYLKSLLDKGEIQDLRLQVKYELIPAQYEQTIVYTPKKHQAKVIKRNIERKLEYIADFVYIQNGETIVEDVKGYRRGGAYSVFVIKRKLMLYIHSIKVREV